MTPSTKSLRELALAATPGPWRSHNEQTHLGVSNAEIASHCVRGDDDDRRLADVYSPNKIANAAFIAAANPSVVLGLLNEVERLQSHFEPVFENGQTLEEVRAVGAHDRYFVDHGVVHDRETSKHVFSDDAARELNILRSQLAAARLAARRLISHVDNLGAFADDNDPRVIALTLPLAEAQADLWIALGLDVNQEAARLHADVDSRCAVCGWLLAESVDKGCVRGNCSMRPRPAKLYAPERAAKEAQ